MLATQRLTSDHRAFLKLLDRLEALSFMPSRRALAKFQSTLGLLLTPLLLHTQLEEDFLFPPLNARLASRDKKAELPGQTLVLEHDELHRLIGRLHGALRRPEDIPADFMDTVRRFCDRLRQHIFAEDTMVFPLAENLLGAHRLERIARDMHQRVLRVRRVA
jgi:iron-sulfur cluster repair protein YtfE (RIC family)